MPASAKHDNGGYRVRHALTPTLKLRFRTRHERDQPFLVPGLLGTSLFRTEWFTFGKHPTDSHRFQYTEVVADEFLDG